MIFPSAPVAYRDQRSIKVRLRSSRSEAMLMLLRRMGVESATVHGFRSTFRVWASEVAKAPREVAEMSLAHKVGNEVERASAPRRHRRSASISAAR